MLLSLLFLLFSRSLQITQHDIAVANSGLVCAAFFHTRHHHLCLYLFHNHSTHCMLMLIDIFPQYHNPWVLNLMQNLMEPV